MHESWTFLFALFEKVDGREGFSISRQKKQFSFLLRSASPPGLLIQTITATTRFRCSFSYRLSLWYIKLFPPPHHHHQPLPPHQYCHQNGDYCTGPRHRDHPALSAGPVLWLCCPGFIHIHHHKHHHHVKEPTSVLKLRCACPPRHPRATTGRQQRQLVGELSPVGDPSLQSCRRWQYQRSFSN